MYKRNKKPVDSKSGNLPAATDEVYHEINDESEKYSQKTPIAQLDTDTWAETVMTIQ